MPSITFPTYRNIIDKDLCKSFIRLIHTTYSAIYTSPESGALLTILRNNNSDEEKWGAIRNYLRNPNYRNKTLYKLILNHVNSLTKLNEPSEELNVLPEECVFTTTLLRDLNLEEKQKFKTLLENHVQNKINPLDCDLYSTHLITQLNAKPVADENFVEPLLQTMHKGFQHNFTLQSFFADPANSHELRKRLARRFHQQASNRELTRLERETFYKKAATYFNSLSPISKENLRFKYECYEFLGLDGKTYKELQNIRYLEQGNDPALISYRNRALDRLLKDRQRNLVVLPVNQSKSAYSRRDFTEKYVEGVKAGCAPGKELCYTPLLPIGLCALGVGFFAGSIGGGIAGFVRASTRSPLSIAGQTRIINKLEELNEISSENKFKIIQAICRAYGKVRNSSSQSSKELIELLKQGFIAPGLPQPTVPNDALIRLQWQAIQAFMLQKSKDGRLYQNNGKRLYTIIHNELNNFEAPVQHRSLIKAKQD